MFARWIATVAALLLVCAQASAHVRSERATDLGTFAAHTEHALEIQRSAANASPGELPTNPKIAPPARASLENSASGKNALISDCHVWENWSPLKKCASGVHKYLYANGNPGSYIDPDGQVAFLSEWEKDTAETVEGYDNEIDQAVEQDAGGRAFWLGVGRGLAWAGNKVVSGLNTTSNLVAQGLYDGETYAQAERELSVNRLAMTDGIESTHQTAKVIAEDPNGAVVAVHGSAVMFATDLAMGDPRALSKLGEATGQAFIPGVGGKSLKALGDTADAVRRASRLDAQLGSRDIAKELDEAFSRAGENQLSPRPRADFSKYSTKEIGDLGEQVTVEMLQRNGYSDVLPIQNQSGHGVDIVARTPDGRVAFFEVKTSGAGRIGDLSDAQANFGSFVTDRLSRASSGTGAYRHLSASDRTRARQYLREYNRDPSSATGAAVGVDLEAGLLRVSPWKNPGLPQ